MLLSELLKKMRKNDLIYCSENEEPGGWIMRGNEWDTKTANRWIVERIFINSSGNLQCYVSEI